MLEAADLNDNTILEQTKQETDSKGRIRFKITLPDGHLLTSDWFNHEEKTTALLIKWTESVKEQVVVREKEKQEELNAVLRRQRADKDQTAQAEAAAAMGLIVPSMSPAGSSGVATLPMRPVQSVMASNEPAQVSSMTAADPVAMARAQLVAATMDVQNLTPRLADAQRRVAQWQAVLTALNGIELPKDSLVIQMSTKLD